MKKLLFISLLFCSIANGQIVSLVYHGDTLIAKNPLTGDSNIVVSGACAKWIINNYASFVSVLNNLSALSNTSGTNTGDNAVNSNYAADYRAGNFIAGTNYVAPSVSTLASLIITESQVTNLTSDLSGKAPLASPAFTGSATGIGLPVYARVTSSNFTTTGQSLTNVTGLSVALTTNATYEFEAELSVSTSAVTTGCEYGVNFSSSGATIEAGLQGGLTSTADKSERISALNTATSAYLTTSSQSGRVLIKGIITTTTNSGNLTIETLKVTSGTSTVFINSFLKVTRIL